MDTKLPMIVMASGETFTISRVLLYDQQAVAEVLALRAQAASGLGGFSSGIGFFGSPEWVVGGAAVRGVVEGLLSHIIRKKGFETLRSAYTKSEELITSVVWFEIEDIRHSTIPNPSTWYAVALEGVASFIAGTNLFASTQTKVR